MESFENDITIVDVGTRLRQLRQERGKSMRALARDSGLSTNALSMIERGLSSPSVSTLYKISGGLHIPITAFFWEEPAQKDIVFCKVSGRTQVKFPNGVWEGLGGETFTGHIEPILLTLEGGASSGPFGMIHSGHEFVFCISGQIEYEIENQKYILDEGDSLIFAAELRHRWRNIGETTTTAIVVLAGFEPRERPSEYHITSGMKGE